MSANTSTLLVNRPCRKIRRAFPAGCLFFFLLTLFACGGNTGQWTFDGKKDYENAEKFDQYVALLHDSLGKKYHIKDLGFDVECIADAQSLTSLVKEMIDSLGGIASVTTKEGHDEKNKQFYSILSIRQKEYAFRTTDETDYVELDKIMPVLAQIGQDVRPATNTILATSMAVR